MMNKAMIINPNWYYLLDEMQSCSEEEFRCGSGQCIPMDWMCDGEVDCPQGLDEWDNLCSKIILIIITPASVTQNSCWKLFCCIIFILRKDHN